MGFVVTLEGLRPGSRFDGEPWTQARLEQSVAAAGPWTVLETQEFDEIDEDPREPRSRDLTTDEATISTGWFRAVFLDADAGEQPSAAVFFPDPGMRPELADVGALIRARTKDANGNELGTFTDATRPTDDQADRIISVAASDVAMRVSESIPHNLYGAAREAVSIRAAQLIELSFFPEATEDRMTAYQSLRLTYEEVIARLVSIVATRALFAEVEPAETP